MTVSEQPNLEETYSEAIQDFLKAIYLLEQEHERVQTSILAEYLGITAPSTTEMAKKLARARLVVHEPYRGVRLTEAGRRVALEIIRNHRLIELFLVETLGYTWDEVHDEAERLEHAVSDRFIQRVAEFLGHPHFDPHGDPIPGPQGELSLRELAPLALMMRGQEGSIARLRDQSSDMLRYLADKGLTIGARVKVVAIDPFEGPITLETDGEKQIIGRNVAQYVLIALDQ